MQSPKNPSRTIRKLALALLATVLCISVNGCGGGGGGGGEVSTGNPETSIQTQQPLPNDGPGDTEKLFSLTTGNSWVFQATIAETGQAPINRTENLRVTGTKFVNGETASVLTSTYSDRPGMVEEEYVVKNNAAIYYVGNNKFTDSLTPLIVPYPALKFPATPNSSFVQVNKDKIDFGSDIDGDGRHELLSLQATVTVLGNEAVTVPAGTFANCVKFRTDLTETVTLTRNGARVTMTGTLMEWYAPGIGPVKRHSESVAPGYLKVLDYALVAFNVDGKNEKIISDTIPPGISGVEPRPGFEMGVAGTVQAVFSEAMDPASLDSTTFIVRDVASNPVSGAITCSGRTATFLPTPAFANGTYTATVTTEARDLAGHGLPADFSWSFSVDNTVPAVVSTTPANGATDVVVSHVSPITVTFNKDMDVMTFDSASFIVSSPGGPVAGYVFYSSKTVTFRPDISVSFVPGTIYTVTITSAAKDLAGRALPSVYQSSFTAGYGPFLPVTTITTGSSPQAVAIGDVNGDGKNDVAMVTSYYSSPGNDGMLFIFLQNGTGGLDPPVKYATAGTFENGPSAVAIGDMNRDGRNDVVVGNFGANIQVYLQDGSGQLGAPVTYATVDSDKIRIADLNHDGLLDVVGIGPGASTVSVFLQNAGGALDPPVVYSVAYSQYSDLDVGDVNNDGLVDIVVMSGQGESTHVWVLTQKSDGGLNAPQNCSVSSQLLLLGKGVAVGDVNGDGLSDVAVSYGGNSPYSKVGVLYQNVQGTLNSITSLDSYDTPGPIEIADIDGDGRKDVVVAHPAWNALGIYWQRPDGTLKPEDRYVMGTDQRNPNGMAVGDINGDGLNDVVIAGASYANCGLVVHYRRAAAAFPSAVSFFASPPPPAASALFKGLLPRGF